MRPREMKTVSRSITAQICCVLRRMPAKCIDRTSPDGLQALEREWDVERALETNASSLIRAGLSLGLWLSRRFFILPTRSAASRRNTGLQGWCPSMPVLRRMGFHAQTEKHALLAFAPDTAITQ